MSDTRPVNSGFAQFDVFLSRSLVTDLPAATAESFSELRGDYHGNCDSGSGD